MVKSKQKKIAVLMKHICIGGTEKRIYNIVKYLPEYRWYILYEEERRYSYGFSSLPQVALIERMDSSEDLYKFFKDCFPDIFIFYASELPLMAFHSLPKDDFNRMSVFYTVGTTSHISLEPLEKLRYFIDAIVVVSRQLLEIVKGSVYIPTGVDLNTLRFRKRFKLNDIKFGYIGRIASKKRVDRIPDALAGIVKDLYIAGTVVDENMYISLQNKCKRLGINLINLGKSIDISNLLNQIDVLIHFSEREGMPNIVLEASACGVPSIATPVGDLKDSEFLNDYHIKYVNNIQELRKAIEYFMYRPSEVGRIGFNAYSLVKRKRRAEDMANKWKELFDIYSFDSNKKKI